MSDEQVSRLEPEPGRLATLRVASERFRRGRNASSSGIEWLTARSSRLFASYHFQFPPRWRVKLRAFPSTANRAKPDFVSIGPVRSGTSALANYVFQHPCVALPFAKEITGRKEWHYLAQMPTKKVMRRIEERFGMALTGFATPVMPSPRFPFIARTLNPAMKAIVILRNPTERAISHWRWEYHKSHRKIRSGRLLVRPAFAEWVEHDIENITAGGRGLDTLAGSQGIVQSGIYLPFIRSLHRQLGRENVLVVDANAVFANPVSSVDEVCAFLGLPPLRIAAIHKNESLPIPQEVEDEVTTEAVERLREFYRRYNEELYRYLERDLEWA